MSIQDIADYVRQTPGNTNPSVIKSMVKSEVGEYVEEASNEALRKLGIKEDISKVVIVPEASYTLENGETVLLVTEPLSEGDEVTLVIDGTEYTETVKVIDLGGESSLYLGNLTTLELDIGADKPYLVLPGADGSAVGFGLIEEVLEDVETSTHTIGIYVMEETTTPISGKYFPEGGVGYTELMKSLIAPEQTVECIYNPELGGCFTGITFTSPQPTPPEKLYFSVDGTIYECEKKAFNDEIIYGNISIAGQPEDTGEPFVFMYDPIEVWEGLFKGDTSFSCTISVQKEDEILHPIDSKYLPEGFGDGGLPVVLEVPGAVFTQILEGDTGALPLDAEMAGIIEKAYSDNVPLYLRTNTATGMIQVKYECTNYLFDETAGETSIRFIGMMNLGQLVINGVTYTRSGSGSSITSVTKALL